MVLCILEVLDKNPKKATDPFPNKTAPSQGKGTALHCQAGSPDLSDRLHFWPGSDFVVTLH